MVTIKLSNKTAYSLILILLVLTASLIAYAYSSVPNPGHGGEGIVINIGGQEKTLQNAIDEGDFSGGCEMKTGEYLGDGSNERNVNANIDLNSGNWYIHVWHQSSGYNEHAFKNNVESGSLILSEHGRNSIYGYSNNKGILKGTPTGFRVSNSEVQGGRGELNINGEKYSYIVHKC